MYSYLHCGEAYRREHEEQDKAPPTSPMIRGLSLHRVAAEGHARQLAARKADPTATKSVVLAESLPSKEEAADLVATHFEKVRAAQGVQAPPHKTLTPQQVVGRDKDAAIRMGTHYVETWAPYVDPIFVEHKVEVSPKDADIELVGVMDLGTLEPPEEPGGEEEECVTDLKSKTSPPDADEADESEQLTMYALFRKLETGKIPRVALNHVMLKDKLFTSPVVIAQRSTRTEADLGVIVRRINNAVKGVKAGMFLANGVGQWYCSSKWCRFHSTCPFVRQRS